VVSIYSVSRNFKTPYAELFGLNIEQSLGKAWQLNIGYVGSVQPPQPRPAGHQPVRSRSRRPEHGDRHRQRKCFTAQQATRPYFSKFPNFGIINQINSAASSSYNALQVTLRSSSWHGLTSQFAYAWSHNLDDSSVFNTIPQNSLNLAGDWGNANQDIRNHFSAYLNYAIPASRTDRRL
jgi:hypothetical protein